MGNMECWDSQEWRDRTCEMLFVGTTLTSYSVPSNCLCRIFQYVSTTRSEQLMQNFTFASWTQKSHSTYGPSIVGHSVADISAPHPTPLAPMNTNDMESTTVPPLLPLEPPGLSANKNPTNNVDIFGKPIPSEVEICLDHCNTLTKHNNNLRIASLGVIG